MLREVCVFCVIFAAFVVTAATVTAQSPVRSTCESMMFQDGDKSERTFLGLKGCFNCHANGLPTDDFGARFGIMADDSWVEANEVQTWDTDKHAQAYTSLLSDAGTRIGQSMGIAVHRDKRCLACHTGFPIAELEVADGQIAIEYENDPQVTLGVSCEGCHGPAGGAQGWLGAHTNKELWRFLSTEKKCEKGFHDVRSVISRTRLCLSCHLGNASQGRVLTHEMYAAGHPPLPAFELATFEEQMPKHWRHISEKDEKLQREFSKETGIEFNPDEMHRTQSLLVAALVSRSESLRLTADLAAGSVSMQIPKPQWPEFAQFDCYACHHDLTSEGWRQSAQHAGSPGRPRLLPWPGSLSRLAALQAHSAAEEVLREFSAVRSATLVSPFGDREALIEAARTSADWSDKLAVSLDGQEMTATEGAAVLKNIAETAATETLDYDSARQLLWAFTIVESELKVPEERRADLAAARGMFVLNLREGREAKHQISPKSTPREVLEVDMKKTLERTAIYDAIAFQRAFAALRLRDQTPQPLDIPK